MIKITYSGDDKGFFVKSSGHAGYNPGNDPVCASVSALMYALAGTLENYGGKGTKKVRIGAGVMSIRYDPADEHETAMVSMAFNTIIIGILQIEAQYPGFVSVNNASVGVKAS